MTQGKLNEKLLNTAEWGDIAGVKEAISLGADVNSANKYGYTALIWSACYGYTDIIKLLLEHSAKTDLKERNGDTALMKAAWYGYTDIARLLIEYGADIHTVDKYGNTALTNACWKGHTDIAKLLIEHGADINIRNSDGYTALDILKKQYSDKYKKWIETAARKKQLEKEDSVGSVDIVPDWNI